MHTTEQGRKNQNYAAESEIGLLARRWKSRMHKRQIPKRLWDFGVVYESELLCRMARGTDKRTGYEKITGQTPDINEWLDFEFYDLVWWLDRPTKPDFSDRTRRLARWLGVSDCVGSDMCYWLVHVTQDDYLQPEIKTKIEQFCKQIEESLVDTNFDIEGADDFRNMYLQDTGDDATHLGVCRNNAMVPSDNDYGDMATGERPDDDEEAIDKYLNAELIMDRNQQRATWACRQALPGTRWKTC